MYRPVVSQSRVRPGPDPRRHLHSLGASSVPGLSFHICKNGVETAPVSWGDRVT